MPTGITSSTAFRNSAFDGGRVQFLDAGPAAARIELYSGTRPENGAAPAGTLLASITLSKPCASVAGGVASLLSTDEPLVLATGTPTWARVFNGANQHAFDCDASEAGGAGQVQVPIVPMFAGGTTGLAAATLTQP